MDSRLESFIEACDAVSVEKFLGHNYDAKVLGKNSNFGIICDYRKSKGGVNKMSKTLEFFEPEEFKVSWCKTYDPKCIWLSPIREDETTELDWKNATRRARDELKICGLANISETLFLVCNAICYQLGSKALYNNIYLRHLKYYLSLYKGEMFREVGDSMERIKFDLMGSRRVLLCINAARYSAWSCMEEKCLYEQFLFLFKDPYVNTVHLKVSTAVHRVSLGSNVVNGKAFQWKHVSLDSEECSLSKFDLVDIPKWEDRIHYAYVKGKLDEEQDSMKKLGLNYTRELLHQVVVKFNFDIHERYLNWLVGFTGPTGFCRSNKNMSHYEQVTSADDNEFSSTESLLPAKLRDIYQVWFEKGIKEGYIDLSEEYVLRNQIKVLTNKSAGNGMKKASFLTRIDEGQTEIKVVTNSKVFLFWLRPDAFYGKNVFIGSSENDPWIGGNRDVTGGKPSRMISANPGFNILGEWPYWSALARMQMSKKDTGYKVGTFGNSSNFVLGSEQGNVFKDHWRTIYSTGALNEKIISMGADFTKFDAASKRLNTREPYMHGMLNGFISSGLVSREGLVREIEQEHTFYEFLEAIEGDGIKGEKFMGFDNVWEHFKKVEQLMVNVYMNFGELGIHIVDGIMSGELKTINYHNFTNLANFETIYESFLEVKDLFNSFNFLHIQFHGDDNLSFWSTNGNYDLDGHAGLIKLYADISKKNGFDVNIYKTLFRFRMTEFLKKFCFYGGVISLLSTLQETNSEKKMNTTDIIGKMLAVKGFMGKMVSRGADTNYCDGFLISMFIHERARKVNNVLKRDIIYNEDRTIVYHIPACVMIMPISMGGCGIYPGLELMPNQDLLLMRRIVKSESLRYKCSIGAELMSKAKSEVKKTIIDNILSGKIYTKNEFGKAEYIKHKKRYQRYMNKYVMKKERLQIAQEKNESLLKLGIDVGDLYYGETPIRLEKRILDSNPALNDILRMNLQRKYAKMMKYSIELSEKWSDEEYVVHSSISKASWLGLISVSYKDEMKFRIQKSPYYALDEKIQNVIKLVGINTEHQALQDPGFQIDEILSRDKFFPRDIQATSVLELLSRPVIYSDEQILVDVIQTLGGSLSTGEQIAAVLGKLSIADLSMREAFSTFSWGDDIIPILDYSNFRSNHCKVLSTLSVDFQEFIYKVGFNLWLERVCIEGKACDTVILVMSDLCVKSFLVDYLNLKRSNYVDMQMLIPDANDFDN